MTKISNISGFKKFLESGLKNKSFGDDQRRDFAEDVLADDTFRDFKNWDDLKIYLTFRGVCVETIKAAKSCYVDWEASNVAH